MSRIMGRIKWRFRAFPKDLLGRIRQRIFYIQQCFWSLFYNKHVNQSYVSDVCLEPIFWIVDNYTHILGPFFVAGVALLTAAVVFISYWIGLPYWWEKSPKFTIVLLILGNWLLVNVVFHYFMAARTPPGNPPERELLIEAVSICRKCISPKPPRTHHCSVCNKCVLKMDHHCQTIRKTACRNLNLKLRTMSLMDFNKKTTGCRCWSLDRLIGLHVDRPYLSALVRLNIIAGSV